MARPAHFSDGATPARGDTKWRIWSKILGKFQDLRDGAANNDPKRNDTKWTLKEKLNRTLTQ